MNGQQQSTSKSSKKTASQHRGGESQARAGEWSARRRLIVSLLVSIHVAAVFIPPFTFATSTGPGDASPFARPLMAAWQPYIDVLFLNHGYFFFAPNPGPNHLLRVELTFEDGKRSETYMIPDRTREWPRLYYHRHFMMTETLHGLYAPAEPPPEVALDAIARQQWEVARARYERMRDAFAHHIAVETGAASVGLTRVEHRQPTPYEFLEEGVGLTDPRLYRDLPD